MNTEIQEATIPIVYQTNLHGMDIPSRYGPCREMINGHHSQCARSMVIKTGMNYTLGWMELLQVVAGIFDIEAIKRVAPNANHSLFTSEMAYGPRLTGQLEEAIDTLKRDPYSRQAVMFIGEPLDGMTSRLPCTLTMQFFRRNDILNAVVSMRSWDLCRGLPYDLMVFGGLLEIVAICLGIPSGILHVNAGSAHIYEDQKDKLPRWSKLIWEFFEGPETLDQFYVWACENIRYLQKGEVPGCIQYLPQL